jgi:hypothetical protein
MALHLRALETSVVAPVLDKKISVSIVASITTDPKLGEPKQMVGYIKPATTTALISVNNNCAEPDRFTWRGNFLWGNLVFNS